MSNYQLLQKLKKAFEKAKKSDRPFERALHFRGDMFRLEEELFEALGTKVDQVESAAVKAAHKVMEQHSEAFEKLEENKKMKITEKEFDAVEHGLCVASNEDMLDENVAYPAFEKMKKVYEHYHFLMDELGMYEREELKKQVEELKKENAELQRELSVHNFLDTGVPQERLDYQRELKKEIIRLKSLCRRAADEIRDLDNAIIDFVEGNAFPQKNEDDLWAGEASINLLNRLDGRTSGGYVENYEDLLSEMNAIDAGKWYNCAHCDAGYPDQECTCEENKE